MIRRFLAIALPVVFLAGCASTQEAATSGVTTVMFELENNLTPPQPMDVWLVPETGGRSLVASVPAQSTETVGTDVPDLTGQYRLVAEAADGTRVLSDMFIIDQGAAAISWDMRANFVQTKGT